ncbi:MAG: PilZ domain-containing protein [Sphingomonas sp.]|nr:PilZ domain-containing protein [Sphingomonas sp.]
MDIDFSRHPVADQDFQERPASGRTERRSGKRTKMLFKVGIVESAQSHSFCLIKEISNEGMRIVHSNELLPGDEVSVTLEDMTVLKGRIAWTKGRTSGIRLDEAIDCDRLLLQLSLERRSSFARALRLPIDIPVTVLSVNGRKEMIVRDISQRGLKVEHDGSFREGMLVHVILSDGRERPAVARWSKGHFAGLLLLNPFHPHELLSLKAPQKD